MWNYSEHPFGGAGDFEFCNGNILGVVRKFSVEKVSIHLS